MPKPKAAPMKKRPSGGRVTKAAPEPKMKTKMKTSTSVKRKSPGSMKIKSNRGGK